jgi:cytochrome c oxidase assembly factor CtaG
MGIRWGRVIVGAFLLEIVLMVTLTPLSLLSSTVFLTAVPIGVFVFGYLVSWRILRQVPSRPLTHGALLGVLATAMYVALISAAPGGFQGAVQTYGAPLFWFCQAMRVAGCLAGAVRTDPRDAPRL